ncbi:MAG: prepilin-type N-terminal cleavage/methylation domain-containing protein [Planctomycetes bacterium]|nr:prepilin-type N-terminal cleavage/methylation domain-containing protein [Planctomycetota bacterium]
MNVCNENRKGFTLAELLVAMALGLIVLSMVGYAFHNTTKASSRALSLILSDSEAKSVMDLIQEDLENLDPIANYSLDGSKMTFLAASSDSSTGLMWISWVYDNSVTENIVVKRATLEADATNPPSKTVAQVESAMTYGEIIGELPSDTVTLCSPTITGAVGKFDGTSITNAGTVTISLYFGSTGDSHLVTRTISINGTEIK